LSRTYPTIHEQILKDKEKPIEASKDYLDEPILHILRGGGEELTAKSITEKLKDKFPDVKYFDVIKRLIVLVEKGKIKRIEDREGNLKYTIEDCFRSENYYNF
jgi:hypothetical protein